VHGSTHGFTPYGYRRSTLAKSTIAYTGEWFEPSIDGYLLGNGYRAYNASLMRFYSPDSFSPFGKGLLNAYCYCNEDPINNVDRTGHAPTGNASQQSRPSKIIPSTFKYASSSRPAVDKLQQPSTTKPNTLTSTSQTPSTQDTLHSSTHKKTITLSAYIKTLEQHNAAIDNIKPELKKAEESGNIGKLNALTAVLDIAMEQKTRHTEILDNGQVYTIIRGERRLIGGITNSSPAKINSEIRD
jgi:RHS repeat-associated protein